MDPSLYLYIPWMVIIITFKNNKNLLGIWYCEIGRIFDISQIKGIVVVLCKTPEKIGVHCKNIISLKPPFDVKLYENGKEMSLQKKKKKRKLCLGKFVKEGINGVVNLKRVRSIQWGVKIRRWFFFSLLPSQNHIWYIRGICV